MEKKDGRAVSHDMLEQIRIQAVHRVLAGENPEETMRRLGLNRACIYRWISIYKEKGEDGLRAKRIAGRPQKFAPENVKRLEETLSALHDGRFEPTAYIWNISAVQELVSDEYNVELSKKTIERIIHRAGIISQNDTDIRTLINSTADSFLNVKQLAKQTGRELFIYAEKTTRSKEDKEETLYLALPVQGDCFFMLQKGRPKTCVMTEFITRFSDLLRKAERNAILAIDRSKYDVPAWATHHIASVCDAVRIEIM